MHAHLINNSDLSGLQKFHKTIVPRIGGLGIAIGILMAILYRLESSPNLNFGILILLCAIPAFGSGLAEDIIKKVGVRTRLFLTGISLTHCCGRISQITLPHY